MRNQETNEWIKRIISRDILTCQSMLVEKLLESGIVEYDDIVNQYIDNSEEIKELEEEIEKLEDRRTDLESDYDDLDDEKDKKEIRAKMDANEQEQKKIKEKIEELEEQKERLEEEQQEAYEWWVVTDWLANHLEEMGEIVLNSDYGTWWGRQCTGQAISLDNTMDELYNKIYN